VAVEDFLKTLGKRANKNLTSLTAADVQRFLDHRMAKGLAPKTVNVDVKIIRGALNAARRQGLIPTNPAEAVELPEFDLCFRFAGNINYCQLWRPVRATINSTIYCENLRKTSNATFILASRHSRKTSSNRACKKFFNLRLGKLKHEPKRTPQTWKDGPTSALHRMGCFVVMSN
jgi:hypothetical protein